MFGDMMGMMNKLKETQKKVEETKERLNHILVDEQSSDGKLKVTLTANRTIKSIAINDELLQDKERPAITNKCQEYLRHCFFDGCALKLRYCKKAASLQLLQLERNMHRTSKCLRALRADTCPPPTRAIAMETPMKKMTAALALSSAAFAAHAIPIPIVLDFEGIGNFNPVGNF